MTKSRALTVLSALSVAGALSLSGVTGTAAPTAAVAATAAPTVIHHYPYVNENMTFAKILKDPAFAGFSRYVVPTEDPIQTDGIKYMTIRQFVPIVGWHDPKTMAGGLNFIISEVNSGLKIWHPLYSQAEIAANPTKKNAGLWFIPGVPNQPLAVIAAGGAFQDVESIQEGFPLAKVLHARGFNVAILKYRVQPRGGKGGQGTVSPAEQHADRDMLAAMTLLKRHAAAWHISLSNYSVWGASAGGALVSDWVALSGPNTATTDGFNQPAVVVNEYTPPYNINVSASLPPFFITDCADDQTVSPAAVKAEAAQFKAAGAIYEFKRYPTGGHGFGIGVGTSANGWFRLAIAFWRAHMAG
jgi:acetyl esterase/lipase